MAVGCGYGCQVFYKYGRAAIVGCEVGTILKCILFI